MHNLRDFTHGGNIHGFKRRIVDFSANINPLEAPKSIKQLFVRKFDLIFHYPDPQAEKLRKAIANYWDVGRENILAGNGSIELLFTVVNFFKPRSICIPAPSFTEYEKVARLAGSRISFVKLKEDNDFKLDLSKLTKSDMLIIANPNNPTGNLLIENPQVLLRCFKGIIVVDEAFMDWVPDEKVLSFIRIAKRNKRVMVLRTFTKFFALPGIRAGYMISHKDTIRRLRDFQVPWSCNSFAQLAATSIIKDGGYIDKSLTFIEKERSFLFASLNSIRNLHPYPSEANFILVKILNAGAHNATSLRKRLMKKGILIRDCSNFRGLYNRFIRVAVKGRKENKCLVRELERIYGKK